MKWKRYLCMLGAGISALAQAQVVTLDDCRELVRSNYPLVRQYGLLEQAREYTLENASKGYLPQFSLSGKASYQSDVTKLPTEVLDRFGVSIGEMPKDQYSVVAEVQQSIWDGGVIRANKRKASAATEEATEQLNVSMYALNRQVNELYFGLLLLEEQLRLNSLLNQNLTHSLDNVSAYEKNGMASPSDVDAVKVELLNTRQKRAELETSRTAYLRMLSILAGQEWTDSVTFVKPEAEEPVSPLAVFRPELNWYDAQLRTLDVEEKSLRTGYMPRLGLFFQGGYGNPGLNMLEDKFRLYYVAGVRFSWNFGSLYTLKNNRKNLQTSRMQVESNRDVFLWNTRMEASRQSEAVRSVRRQMADDEEIIRLRTGIRKAAEAEVANGTMSVTDMLQEITNEDMARQNKSLHEIQLLMNIYQLKHTTNQ